MLVRNKFWSKKVFIPKTNFWSKKKLGLKKNFGWKQIFGKKNFGAKKLLSPKNVWTGFLVILGLSLGIDQAEQQLSPDLSFVIQTYGPDF